MWVVFDKIFLGLSTNQSPNLLNSDVTQDPRQQYYIGFKDSNNADNLPESLKRWMNSAQMTKSEVNLTILENYDYEIVEKQNPANGHKCTIFRWTYKDCRKEMETTWNMLDHARMHKGIKPFVCQYWHKRFTQKGNMRKHAKLHLTPHVDARRKYKCRFWGGGFTEKYNLMVRKSSNSLLFLKS